MARADGGDDDNYVYHTTITTMLYVVPRRGHRSPPLVWRPLPYIRPSVEQPLSSILLFGFIALVAKEPTVAHAIHFDFKKLLV